MLRIPRKNPEGKEKCGQDSKNNFTEEKEDGRADFFVVLFSCIIKTFLLV